MKLVIDGTNILHIAYWTAKAITPDFDNNTESYVSLFFILIRSYAKKYRPEETIICWDDRPEGFSNFRKELSGEYKGTREFNPGIYEHHEKLLEMISSLGIRQMRPKTREADDILYWYAKIYDPGNCVLVSADTDLYQLVDESGNILYDPRKKSEVWPQLLKKKFEVSNGRDFILRKALKGDSADNIKGVYRIRKDRIKNIIKQLNDGNTIEDVVSAGLLTEDESKTFSYNLELMCLDSLRDDSDELSWYEEQANTELVKNVPHFKSICYDFGFKKMYREAADWAFWFTLDKELEISNYVLTF